MSPSQPTPGEVLNGESVRLLPCPFCGCAPKLIEQRGGTTIHCVNDQCIISTDVPIPFNDIGHRADAIAAWNRRPQPGEITEAAQNAFYEATTVTREGSILNFDAGLVAAMSALASPVKATGWPSREDVALIVDPRIAGLDFCNYTPDSWMGKALAKADAVLALFPTTPIKVEAHE